MKIRIVIIIIFLFNILLFSQVIRMNHNNFITNVNNSMELENVLSNYKNGEVIKLAPSYFNKDIIITLDSVVLQGESKFLSRIKSLTVIGKHCKLSNFTVIGKTTFLSQATYYGSYDYKNKTIVENINFEGGLELGTDSLSLIENVAITNCKIIGTSPIVVNFNNKIRLKNVSIKTESSFRPNLYVYGGTIAFYHSSLFLDSLIYMQPDKETYVDFYNCDRTFISEIKTTSSTVFHMLGIFESHADLGDYQELGDIVFDGKFELDIVNSSLAIWKDIVFNSSANSRIMNFIQRGWQSNSIIKGTGLIYLRIYNSVLAGNAPSGLGDDRGNVWNAFMDD